MNPLCIELFCGTFGWSASWLARGGRVVGFDIEHQPYHGPIPPGAELVLQDVLTLDGAQFKNASLILASPPCQAYSYMAMPWKRGKAMAAEIRADATGEKLRNLTALFDACFRIQREASAAAGHHIPMVVENVKGAQPWVGAAKAHFGSFYLWSDVESVGGRVVVPSAGFGAPTVRAIRGGKNDGGSWFGVANNTYSGVGRNPVNGRKVPDMNFHDHEKTGQPGRSFQSAAVKSTGVKSTGVNWNGYGEPGYRPQGFNVVNAQRYREGAKQMSGLRGFSHPAGNGKRDLGGPNDLRRFGSKSDSRRAASALIAKIPAELSNFVAEAYWPL